MTNYDRGAAFERRVLQDMEGRGYACVRSAGSHSPADLACMLRGAVVCVQCKTNGRLDPGEWDEFVDFCGEAGALPVMAENAKGEIKYWRLEGRKGGGGDWRKSPFRPREENRDE